VGTPCNPDIVWQARSLGREKAKSIVKKNQSQKYASAEILG